MILEGLSNAEKKKKKNFGVIVVLQTFSLRVTFNQELPSAYVAIEWGEGLFVTGLNLSFNLFYIYIYISYPFLKKKKKKKT
ncbi:hypothetical protein CROQUDRAFT_566580 [Cronartium quercuum f. sp. fusiforme G11]|uniref:Uncharacterized protein n=1 Tax=Cronartium quercuum f. sp. fusiforme G11 TaxID=708437 RepID=A0A9P6TBB1_9BASI|nr:hypothetical protein CROQUDRAFT_566580 [Cronartium quercuum f. sp. fusiforme G11]